MLEAEDKKINQEVESPNIDAILSEYDEELEDLGTPEVKEVPEAVTEEVEPASVNPFKEKMQAKITQTAESSALELLSAFNETVDNLLSVILDTEQGRFLPPKDKEKKLAKELANLIPDLHIGKGTGLILTITGCYVPVVGKVITVTRERKNNIKVQNAKSKIVHIPRSSGNGQNNNH